MSTEASYYNFKLLPDLIVKTETIYWISKDNHMFSFLTFNQLLKLFPEKSDILKQFIRQNRLKIDNQDHVIRLIKYCNKIVVN